MGLSFDMSQKEFVHREGLDCPLCGREGSAESTAHSYSSEGASVVTDDMMCSACNGHWREIYTLSGYEKI